MKYDFLVKSRLYERKCAILEENYERLSSLYESNERLYHDMNHHLQVLEHMAKQSGNTELIDYIAGISQPVKKLSHYIWSGVDIVDAIINHAIVQYKDNNITLDVNAEFPNTVNVDSNDLCVILFNLLDNALEACINLKEHKVVKDLTVNLNVRAVRGFILFQVKNPYYQKPKSMLGRLLTTKKSSKHHGIGMTNIKRAAEKYSGNVEIDMKDDEFITTVMIVV